MADYIIKIPTIKSPLSQGRELKLKELGKELEPVGKSPLSQGRELKLFVIVGAVRSSSVAPLAGA